MNRDFLVVASTWLAVATTPFAAAAQQLEVEGCFVRSAEVKRDAVIYAARIKECPTFPKVSPQYRGLPFQVSEHWLRPGKSIPACREEALKIWRNVINEQAEEETFCRDAKRLRDHAIGTGDNRDKSPEVLFGVLKQHLRPSETITGVWIDLDHVMGFIALTSFKGAIYMRELDAEGGGGDQFYLMKEQPQNPDKSR